MSFSLSAWTFLSSHFEFLLLVLLLQYLQILQMLILLTLLLVVLLVLTIVASSSTDPTGMTILLCVGVGLFLRTVGTFIERERERE